jgi:hypothetical protein
MFIYYKDFVTDDTLGWSDVAVNDEENQVMLVKGSELDSYLESLEDEVQHNEAMYELLKAHTSKSKVVSFEMYKEIYGHYKDSLDILEKLQ